MRNELNTAFWQKALELLPPGVRQRHLHDIEAVERWELRLQALIELFTCAKDALARLFHTPRSAH